MTDSMTDSMTVCLLLQADAQIKKDRQVFYDASLQYVFKIQEVQERKKFEFVEPVSSLLIVPEKYKFVVLESDTGVK